MVTKYYRKFSLPNKAVSLTNGMIILVCVLKGSFIINFYFSFRMPVILQLNFATKQIF